MKYLECLNEAIQIAIALMEDDQFIASKVLLKSVEIHILPDNAHDADILLYHKLLDLHKNVRLNSFLSIKNYCDRWMTYFYTNIHMYNLQK